jgi:CubicO group peptidase (beta-lactamase class C family)
MEKRCKKYLYHKLEKIISNSLINLVFSSCSIGYFWLEDDKIESGTHHFGFTDIDQNSSRTNEKTVYDLASLTKPLVTALTVMALVEKGKIDLDDEIGSFFQGMRREMGKMRISQLLSHSSGLPAHRPYYETLIGYAHGERKEKLIKLIFDEKLSFQPGSASLYSDLGFMLLGSMIEQTTGAPLDTFWQKEIVQPLSLQDELFFKDTSGSESEKCAATGMCSWSKRKLCGIVHDDNCRALGGVAGHAGLFGTINGVMSMTKELLLQYKGVHRHPAYGSEVLRQFLHKKYGSTWTYGFDTPSLCNSTSGKYFSEMSVGHLGYTGTSFWMDLSRGIGVVLLTNRVLMGNDLLKIKKFRPLIHDTIMEYIIKKPD